MPARRPLVIIDGVTQELPNADSILGTITSQDIASVEIVTQAEYDAIPSPPASTLYIISDASPAFYLLRQISVTTNIVLNAANVWCRVKTSTGARTITLPPTTGLVAGDLVQITDADGSAGSNNITIGRNGATIRNTAADFIIDSNLIGPISFVYDGAGNWELA